MKKSPVSVVRDRFQSKEKLVDAVSKLISEELWLDRLNSTKGLGRVSNAKLIRLHDTLSLAKQRFGTRDKLVSAILELKKRTKDPGYALRLKEYPLPRLLDLHDSVSRSGKAADASAKAVEPKAAKDKQPKAAAAPAGKAVPAAKAKAAAPAAKAKAGAKSSKS
jgi:hypothetical protein